MPRDLCSVDRIDQWPTANGVTQDPLILFIIRVTTVDEHPAYLTLRTLKPLYASVCERAQKTSQRLWVTWQDARHGQKDLIQCEIDTSKWGSEETA